VTRPPLVLAVHGSAHPAYRAAVEAIRCAADERRTAADGAVTLGWLDHEQPDLASAAASAGAAATPVVVLPLLLAAGYHARVDIPAMLAAAPYARVARPLGPDARLARALLRRAQETGADTGTALVVAAAGSSDARALADVESVVAELARLHTAPVRVGYLSGAGQPLAEAVTSLVRAGHDVVALTYLLCPGRLADTVASTALAVGARAVAPPVGGCAEVAAIIDDRWTEASHT
jgi:sirohydrochlorin ferrochelatase